MDLRQHINHWILYFRVQNCDHLLSLQVAPGCTIRLPSILPENLDSDGRKKRGILFTVIKGVSAERLSNARTGFNFRKTSQLLNGKVSKVHKDFKPSKRFQIVIKVLDLYKG